MKHIFFVISFGSIYRRVLPLIDSKKDEDILVVTPNRSIFKFFFNYTKYPVIQVKTNPKLITKSTWYMALSNAIKSKWEYKRLFGDITEAQVYFFGTGTTIVLFSYIQKLAKNNTIQFYSSEPNKLEKQIKPTIIVNWKTKIICKAVKLLLGIDIQVRKDCGLYHLCIYEKFFKKNNINSHYKEFNPRIYKKYIEEIPDIEDKSFLLLLSDLVGEGRVEQKTFEQEMNVLTKLLDTIYPGSYIVKPHPTMNKLHGNMQYAPDIDSYIPSQFLMYHKWKYVIADCSAALVFPEEQNLTNVKLIELLDILTFKDIKVKQEIKQFLQSWNPDLLFPQSFDELEEMLNEE